MKHLIVRNSIDNDITIQYISIVDIDLDFFIRYCIMFSEQAVGLIWDNIKHFFRNYDIDNALIVNTNEDEFIIFLINKYEDEAKEIIDTCRKEFGKKRFLKNVDAKYQNCRITFSAGIAGTNMLTKDGVSIAYRQALVALNMAKAYRRNCVMSYNKRVDIPKDNNYYKANSVVYAGIPGLRANPFEKIEITAPVFDEPQGISIDTNGNVYVVDQNSHSIKKVYNGEVTQIIGNGYYGNNSDYKLNCLNKPTGLFVKDNYVYITDTGNDVVKRFNVDTQELCIICGTGIPGYSGDMDLAIKACLNKPGGVVVDSGGNVYINDIANNVIRKVSSSGYIDTYAGTGRYGFDGDKGAAREATFREIYGIAIDQYDNIYLADYYNHCIRRIDAHTKEIDTVVGCGVKGYEGDGFNPLEAKLDRPVAVAISNEGNMYIAESGNNCIRFVDMQKSVISTFMGGIGWGFESDELKRTFQLANPNGICIDSKGCLYILDGANNRILKCEVLKEEQR